MQNIVNKIKKLFKPGGLEKARNYIKILKIAFMVKRPIPFFAKISSVLNLRHLKTINKFNENHTVLIIGASGGIGKALFESFNIKKCFVVGTYNKTKPKLDLHSERLYKLDLTSEDDINNFYNYFQNFNRKIDLIIFATGELSKSNFSFLESIKDSHALRDESNDFIHSIRVNTLGPYLVCRRFVNLLNYSYKKQAPQICLLSSSIGTMTNEIYGGLYSYRASKGALHALFMAVFCDLNLKKRVGIQIHGPGNVKTKMNPNGLLTANHVATDIIKSLEISSKKPTFQFI